MYTATRLLFAATMFIAAALVFLVQPMAAKELLPTFGGTPGVWNTSVVFFQVALLCGYAIAHLTARWVPTRRQVFVQVGLAALALPLLPFAMHLELAESAPPAVRIALLLGLAVGLPYLAVSTASPMLQRWYAAIGQPDSSEPWFLYSASNAGSMVGLLAFPFLLEPQLSTSGQKWAWVVGFALYAAALVGCVLVVRRRASDAVPAAPAEADAAAAVRAPRWRALQWVLVAALPSSLMLGVTTFITTDVASAPLLWVLPLTLYLLSFVVTFGHRLRVTTRWAGIGVALALIALLLIETHVWDPGEFERMSAHLAAMFFAAVLAHAWLYERRPHVSELTRFYLLLSVGGAIGGAFTALLAPVVFDDVYEYPLLLVAVLLLRPSIIRVGPERPALLRAGVSILELTVAVLAAMVLAPSASSRVELDWMWETPALVIVAGLALLAVRRWGFALALTVILILLTFGEDDSVVHRDRNFFGTLRVEVNDVEESVSLLHGTTLHGTQLTSPGMDRIPTTYYTQQGPLGDVFRLLQEDEPLIEVGAVGLGTGTLMGHWRLFQRFSFYEIDPAVIDVAKDEDHFTWISGANGAARIVEGDARLLLEDEKLKFNLLVLDAYSSDAVPVHLLTVEAMRTYLKRLQPGAVMALHISSRHLDLEPVVAANAEVLGLAARSREDNAAKPEQIVADGTESHWLVLAREEQDLAAFDDAEGWTPLPSAGSVSADDAWTDDFSNVAGSIRWLPWND